MGAIHLHGHAIFNNYLNHGLNPAKPCIATGQKRVFNPSKHEKLVMSNHEHVWGPRTK